MKRILPVCVLALWSALNSQSTLALVQAAPSSVATNPPYVGEKMSLNFQNVEVRTVLQLLADFTGFNLVVSDAVQGSITLNLQDVPWDQALDLVLESKDLGKRLEGNVLRIAPAEHLAARAQHDFAPLRRELVQVNYAKAVDLVRLFQSVTATQPGINGQGTITVDERTNNIIAFESGERLDELRRIVAQLDVPVRQVMIEARIVEAGVDFEKSLGVSWGGTLRRGGNWNAGGITRSAASGGALDNMSAPFVDLGVSGNTSGLGIAFITNNVLLDLELTAMEKTGNGEIISQPKVVTSDKETAKILKGTEIPYQETSASGATSVSFKEASLSLEVTPQITPDNSVIMDVIVTKDEPDYMNRIQDVPPIKKNEVRAKVLVKDGETIVIGGVFSNTQSKVIDKVPFLGDLPYVGQLFRKDVVLEKKSELLVFLTPRIMNNQAIAVSH
ncbi:type IV pilus secretin PilQ family protein [Pseudomonas fragi]|uniref:type IV pilus secretin PilQ n=1 Tax=Pseudomonas fragi TaxID=296 RepID=UPI0028FC1766|nr:type IV pilus secretin PilQ family protein [Pseudomonas fragi]